MKTNYYVGQILPEPNVEGGEELGAEEIAVQFYKSEFPQSEKVFIKLPQIEFAKRETVVEKIGKPEILTNGRIKLLSFPKSGKVV